MDDSSQILIPDAFQALYRSPRTGRLTLPREELAARHEFCEDLAQALTEPARTMLFSHGIAEDEVLRRCRLGLLGEGSAVSVEEAGWVIGRLAELLEWSQPETPLAD
jgi:hypothetical protein